MNRVDFLLVFDNKGGNPNGDPDNNGEPRVDPETGHGFITDVCIKRKIRDTLPFVDAEEPNGRSNEIFLQKGIIINERLQSEYERANGQEPVAEEGKKKKRTKAGENKDLGPQNAQKLICERFFDIRMFGAVMETGDFTAGKVQGPLQLGFARSVSPVHPSYIAMTRSAVTNEKDKNKQGTMGGKSSIPYAVYVQPGFLSGPLADKYGCDERDLDLFFRTCRYMFELVDRSANRPGLTMRHLMIFEHSRKIGNAPSHVLFETVSIGLKPGIEVATCFNDMEFQINMDAIPDAVGLREFSCVDWSKDYIEHKAKKVA